MTLSLIFTHTPLDVMHCLHKLREMHQRGSPEGVERVAH